MSGILEHIKSRTRDEHFRNMREFLEEGDSHFLIGAVFTDTGITPVTFTCGLHNHTIQAITEKTPAAVDALLRSFAEQGHLRS